MPTAQIEPHSKSGQALNRLRAAVLGANDGITSTGGLIVGVAAVTNSSAAVLTAGLAGLLAGALSMAAGEYVSVSSQRDSEQSLLNKEQAELKNQPELEQAELATLYQAKGLTAQTALQVAKELTASNALAAHLDIELGPDPTNLTSPFQAAIASALSFIIGAAIPLLAGLISPAPTRVITIFISVVIALIITGGLSAMAGKAKPIPAIIRVASGGIIVMAVTYIIGKALNLTNV